jgi:O-antigen/teichoic acid export membrane protein
MSELKVLYRHALHYLGGRVCLMLLGFVSFPVFTRVFSVADYGTMALVLKIILLFTVVAKFGLQNSVQRFYAEDGASQDLARSRKYYSTLFFGSVAVAVGVTLLFVAGLLLTPQGFLSRELQYLLLLQPTLVGFLRAEGKTKTFNVVEVSVRAATVIFSCTLLLAWSRSLYVLFGTTLVVEVLAILLLSSYLQRRNLLDLAAVDWSYFKSAAIFSFPLIGYELASVILDSGDRILVRRFLGAEQLGYYSAAYNISTYVEESLMMPINLALFPIYMKIWVEKGKDETQQFLSRSLNNFLALAVAIVCIVFLTSRDVVVVLASRKFQDAHRLLPVLVIGLLIYAIHIFLNAALLIHRKTATMTALVVGACAANILLNLVLIPRIGILGAAIATLLSYLLLVILMGRVSFRLIPLQISFVAFFANLASAGLTYALISRITIEKALLSVIVKGLLGLTVYAALASLLNPVVRAQLLNRIRAFRKKIDPAGAPPAGR